MKGYLCAQPKPSLERVLLDENDITERVLKLYGENRDWNNNVIKYRDFLTEKDIGKVLQVKWRRQNGRIECVIIRVRDLDLLFRGDLFFPVSTTT